MDSIVFFQPRLLGLVTQPKLRKHENQPKTNNESKPTINMVIEEMARLGNPLLIQEILHANGG